MIKKLVVAIAFLMFAPGVALAATFTGNYGVSGGAFSDPGLVVEVDPVGGNFNVDLAVGQTKFVHLFDIWTNETWVNGERSLSIAMPASVRLSATRVVNRSSIGFQYGGMDSIRVTRLDGPTMSTPQAKVSGVNVSPTSVA